MANTDWRSASFSHRGKQRESNEDRCLERPEQGLWLVADGMGGHHRGDFASDMVITVTSDLVLEGELSQRSKTLNVALETAHERLCRVSANSEPALQSGTTVTACVMLGDEGCVLWAGDSRLYRWRDKSLSRLTHDHSFVEELVAQGKLTAEQASYDPRSNIITRAIGIEPSLTLEAVNFSVTSGDRYLLCTDGLFRELGETQLEVILGNAPSPDDAVASLQESALAGAANDNITGVVVFVL